MIVALHKLFRKEMDGMQAFYLNALMRALTFAMTGIFTPVYIYQRSVEMGLGNFKSVAAVAMYFLLVRIVVIIWSIPAAKIIERVGFRLSVLMSVILLMGYLGALIAADQHYWSLGVAAILLGLNVPLYWVSRGSVIALDSNRKKIGKQISWIYILERIAGVVGPLTAGLMIERWGFTTMYGAAMLVLVTSVVPLFSMPHHIHRNGVSWKGYWRWLTDRRFTHQAVASSSRAMDGFAYELVWPLVLFLMGTQFALLGGFYSLLTVITIVVRYGSGFLFDKLYQKRGLEDETMYAVATIGTSMAWIARMFVGTLKGALLLDGGMMMFITTYHNISSDYDTLGGKRMHEIAFYTYKEMTFSLAAIGFCLLWIVGAWYGVWKELLFLTAAVWTLAAIVQGRESNLR